MHNAVADKKFRIKTKQQQQHRHHEEKRRETKKKLKATTIPFNGINLLPLLLLVHVLFYGTRIEVIIWASLCYFITSGLNKSPFISSIAPFTYLSSTRMRCQYINVYTLCSVRLSWTLAAFTQNHISMPTTCTHTRTHVQCHK